MSSESMIRRMKTWMHGGSQGVVDCVTLRIATVIVRTIASKVETSRRIEFEA